MILAEAINHSIQRKQHPGLIFMIAYIYSKCSTCQKALAFLAKKNIPFTKKEITATPPTLKELERMLKYKGSLKKLFNTSGQLYRELQLSDKLDTLSEKEALQLLSQHGMLIKRPFVLGDGFGLLGFKEEEWSKALSESSLV